MNHVSGGNGRSKDTYGPITGRKKDPAYPDGKTKGE